MDVNARVEKKTSKKDKEYYAVFIQLTDEYVKMVFLDKAEILLFNKANSKKA